MHTNARDKPVPAAMHTPVVVAPAEACTSTAASTGMHVCITALLVSCCLEAGCNPCLC
jgi:hypothetical protein